MFWIVIRGERRLCASILTLDSRSASTFRRYFTFFFFFFESLEVHRVEGVTEQNPAVHISHRPSVDYKCWANGCGAFVFPLDASGEL